MLFGEGAVTQMEVMVEVLNKFCSTFGSKISISKTKFLCSQNTSVEFAADIAKVCGFTQVSNLGKYLGIPLIHGKISKDHFTYILEKVNNKLDG